MKRTLSLLLTLALVGAAHAHTRLAETTPGNGSEVAAAPQQLTLRFSAPVTLTMLTVRSATGKTETLGPLPTSPEATFAIAIPALAPGAYVVAWRALSADTHVVRGEFSFSIGDDAAPAANTRTHAEHEAHDAGH